ncbi:DsbE family thiol:disulfide interchange protein [Caldimonas sp. KR1-144]|uniref:DsbE family thiol:disulfide interchange protein n=1 Tax=Caldimonas sp. KR1-144 TaxID=3400911 RepID=UPI003BFD089D
MRRFWLPLLAFAALVALLAAALWRPPAPPGGAAMVGQPAPTLRLARLDAPQRSLGRDDLLGRPWVLNVWASWCAPCRQEMPALKALAATGHVPVVGLNHKDEAAQASAWLAREGDPFVANLVDADGHAGLEWGVVAVPETFVIDRDGIVRFKHSGVLTEALVRERLLPLLESLGG